MLFYGNLTRSQAATMADSAMAAAGAYLDRLSGRLGVSSAELDENLEQWFLDDPVEKIVRLEEAVAPALEQEEKVGKLGEIRIIELTYYCSLLFP